MTYVHSKKTTQPNIVKRMYTELSLGQRSTVRESEVTYIADMAEWCRALDIRLSDWCQCINGVISNRVDGRKQIVSSKI